MQTTAWAPTIRKYNADQPREANGEFGSTNSEANADVNAVLKESVAAFAGDGGDIRQVSLEEANALIEQLADQRHMMEEDNPLSEDEARGFEFTAFALEAAKEEDMQVFVAGVEGLGIAGAMSVTIRDESEFGFEDKYVLVDYVGSTQIASGTGTALANAAYEYAAKNNMSIQGEPIETAASFWDRLGWKEDPNQEGSFYHGLTAKEVKEAIK